MIFQKSYFLRFKKTYDSFKNSAAEKSESASQPNEFYVQLQTLANQRFLEIVKVEIDSRYVIASELPGLVLNIDMNRPSEPIFLSNKLKGHISGLKLEMDSKLFLPDKANYNELIFGQSQKVTFVNFL